MKLRTIRRTLRSRVAVGAAALAIGVTATACQSDTAGPEQGADIEDIQQQEDGVAAGQNDGDVIGADDDFDFTVYEEDPQSFVGQQVTVSAKVTEVLSDSAFRLTGDDVGGSPLLALNAGGGTTVEEGQVVQVSGTVRVVNQENVSEFGDEGWFDADWWDTSFEGQTALFVDSVQVLESGDEGTDQTQGDESS